MTRPLSPVSKADKRLAEAHRGVQSLARRPGQKALGGVAVYEIKVFEDVNVVIAGDGAFYWPIPEDLDEAEIISIEGGVSTPSSSGAVEIQVAFSADGAAGPWSDVLSTKVIIPAGDYNDDETATVSSGGTFPVADGDWLRIDVDAAGDGAQGLALMVTLTPSPLGSLTIAGSKGDPGGVTNWTGAWQTATAYTEGEAVSHNGSSYVAIADHTSGATTEPGVGVDWEDAWMLLAAGHAITQIAYIMEGNAFELTTGIKGPGLPIYFACTILEVTLLAAPAGSVVLDIWKDTYGSYPPTDADSITAAAPMTLVSSDKTTNTSLTGWTTALAAGDVLRFNIDSIALIRSLTVGFKLERT